MQHFTSKATLLVSICLAFMLATTPAVASGAGVNKIKGTWEIIGNPEPTCGVGPFVNLASISRGGTMVNVDPQLGAGVGEIFRVGGKEFAAGFFGFINTGQAILRYEVSGKLTLVNNAYMNGTFTATLFDPAGQAFCSYNGTIEANRLVPDLS